MNLMRVMCFNQVDPKKFLCHRHSESLEREEEEAKKLVIQIA